MVKVEDLYDKTKIPVDEKLVDELIDKYLQISFKDMNDQQLNIGERKISSLLYNKINFVDNNKTEINKQDLDTLITKVQNDFEKAGKPYNPAQYGGVSNPLGIMPGWQVFQSWNLLGTEKIASKDLNHRFYFGIDNSKLYDLSNVLYDELKEANIPFYFKIENNKEAQRRDKIVLYTSSELLPKTLEVIEKVQTNRADLISSCSEPSILMGKQNEKIGYATEGHQSNSSYTDMLCETFTDSIEKSLKDYQSKNSNSSLKEVFKSKLEAYEKRGTKLETVDVKRRILMDLLLKEDPNYKKELLQTFRNELSDKEMDLNNICFNKEIKQEVDTMYQDNTKENAFTKDFDHDLEMERMVNYQEQTEKLPDDVKTLHG